MAESTKVGQPADLADRPEVRSIRARLLRPALTLADYHHVGGQMARLSRDPAVSGRGSGWRDRVAGLVGASVSTLNKAMQFHSLYPEKEQLPELEAIGAGWSRVTVALAVSDPAERLRLLRRAVEGGWSERQMQRAIQQTRGSRRGGGRPRKKLQGQGVLADVLELAALTRQWLDLADDVWRGREADYATEVARMKGDVPPGLRPALEEARERLRDLRARCREAEALVRSLREMLPPAGGAG